MVIICAKTDNFRIGNQYQNSLTQSKIQCVSLQAESKFPFTILTITKIFLYKNGITSWDILEVHCNLVSDTYVLSATFQIMKHLAQCRFDVNGGNFRHFRHAILFYVKQNKSLRISFS